MALLNIHVYSASDLQKFPCWDLSWDACEDWRREPRGQRSGVVQLCLDLHPFQTHQPLLFALQYKVLCGGCLPVDGLRKEVGQETEGKA